MQDIKLIVLTIIFFGFPHVYYGQEKQYCIDSAICNLVRGDVFREVKKPYTEHYTTAANELLKQKQFKDCNATTSKSELHNVILRNCKKRLDECENKLEYDLITELKVPPNLLEGRYCKFSHFSYVVFLCKTVKDWPGEIIVYYGDICISGCSYIAKFEKWNLDRGKNIATDFPPNWAEQIQKFKPKS